MASATRKIVEKTITEDFFVLELTKGEAEALLDLLSTDGGGHLLNGVYDALGESADADDRPIEVGDKVRIIEAYTDSDYTGRIGTVAKIDPPDDVAPYRVDFPNNDYEWAVAVERVND